MKAESEEFGPIQDKPKGAALIVGESPKLLHAIARTLIERGQRVAIAGTNSEVVGAAMSSAGTPPGKLKTFALDLNRPDGGGRLLETVSERVGLVETLVTVASPNRGVIDISDAKGWALLVERDLSRAYMTISSALPHLSQVGGTYTAITSLGGVSGLAHDPARAATAHGIVGLTRSIALGYSEHGVRANAVAYSIMHEESEPTDATQPTYDPILQRIPARRPGNFTDVAAIVAHLSSSESSYVNGTVHVVDGGLTAGYLEADDH